jgi:crotonobetainyl-CoA:carnitine CoA-transferase CaiB-like acyl-CoA transferase
MMKLIAESDVIVENYRADVMDNLGFRTTKCVR